MQEVENKELCRHALYTPCNSLQVTKMKSSEKDGRKSISSVYVKDLIHPRLSWTRGAKRSLARNLRTRIRTKKSMVQKSH